MNALKLRMRTPTALLSLGLLLGACVEPAYPNMSPFPGLGGRAAPGDGNNEKPKIRISQSPLADSCRLIIPRSVLYRALAQSDSELLPTVGRTAGSRRASTMISGIALSAAVAIAGIVFVRRGDKTASRIMIGLLLVAALTHGGYVYGNGAAWIPRYRPSEAYVVPPPESALSQIQVTGTSAPSKPIRLSFGADDAPTLHEAEVTIEVSDAETSVRLILAKNIRLGSDGEEDRFKPKGVFRVEAEDLLRHLDKSLQPPEYIRRK